MIELVCRRLGHAEKGVSTAIERITRQLQIDADLVETVKKLNQ
jgi:hypothetical protein